MGNCQQTEARALDKRHFTRLGDSLLSAPGPCFEPNATLNRLQKCPKLDVRRREQRTAASKRATLRLAALPVARRLPESDPCSQRLDSPLLKALLLRRCGGTGCAIKCRRERTRKDGCPRARAPSSRALAAPWEANSTCPPPGPDRPALPRRAPGRCTVSLTSLRGMGDICPAGQMVSGSVVGGPPWPARSFCSRRAITLSSSSSPLTSLCFVELRDPLPTDAACLVAGPARSAELGARVAPASTRTRPQASPPTRRPARPQPPQPPVLSPRPPSPPCLRGPSSDACIRPRLPPLRRADAQQETVSKSATTTKTGVDRDWRPTSWNAPRHRPLSRPCRPTSTSTHDRHAQRGRSRTGPGGGRRSASQPFSDEGFLRGAARQICCATCGRRPLSTPPSVSTACSKRR